MRCPDCYGIVDKTPFRPQPGLDPRLREYSCTLDHTFYWLISDDELAKEAEQAEPSTTAARMNVA
ncbi:hypothetical protein LCGC14_3124330 [marine sediment metagenome]|uniref:Uncharacterized protein n=1 Tax=marine sediment metagenome TaxID=412755 RepID=A0A0F8W1C5_9ZZZZ